MRLAILLAATAGCATASPSPTVLARGILCYDVAAAGDLVATLELETDFALVLRRPGGTARARLGPHEHDMVDLAVDAGGRRLAVAGLDGTVRLHDGQTGAERARWRLDAAATAVALSGDGAWLVTGAASGVLCLRRTEDGALLHCVAEHTAPLRALATSGDELASGDDAGRLVLWELPSLRVRVRRELGAPVSALAMSASGHVGVGHPPVTALAYAGERLASAGSDGRVLVGDREVARLPAALRGLAVAGGELVVAGFTTGDLQGPSLSRVPLP